MASSTDNVKLGVCNVLFDGVDLGYTKGGVEVEVATTTHEVTVDQFGNTPIAELITGRTVSVNVPMAETTLDNLMAIMPGSEFRTDGAKATGGQITVVAVPDADDTITVGAVTFTFKANPLGTSQIKIGATVNEQASLIGAAIAARPDIGLGVRVEDAVVNLTARVMGVAGNVAVTASTVGITTVNLSGGIDPTYAYVVVSSGINTNLLSRAKELILRPVGTAGEEDFIVYRAACPGAMTFSYQHDAERVFQAAFKGFIREDGMLFAFGDVPVGAH